MTRRAYDAQPDAATVDAVDRRLTQAQIVPDAGPFDTAPVVDVLQGDEHERGVIPVRLVGGPINIDQAPVRTGALFSRALPATMTRAVQLLDTDPRRAAVGFVVPMTPGIEVFFGRTQAEAEAGDGFRIDSSAMGMKRFRFVEDLWALNLSAFATRVGIVTEQWTR